MRRLIVVLLPLPAPACGSRQLYDAGEGWRRHECHRLLDDDERARCMETATMPYDTYRTTVERNNNPQ